MQTKGGGKHDILSVARATAITSECMWMMPRDPDMDMCPEADPAPVSTKDCMAHRNYVAAMRSYTDRSNSGAVRRVLTWICV